MSGVFLRNIDSGITVAVVSNVPIGYFNKCETIFILLLIVVVLPQVVKNSIGSHLLPDISDHISVFSEPHLQTEVCLKQDVGARVNCLAELLVFGKCTAHQHLISC